jgi:hypothetical protein
LTLARWRLDRLALISLSVIRLIAMPVCPVDLPAAPR